MNPPLASRRSSLPLALLALAFLTTAARAGDWPQILGPHRDGSADGEKLPSSWPPAGPAVRWRVPVGQGYAGPAVVGDRVVIFHRVAEGERVEAFALQSGKRLWKADFPANYRGGIDPDHGPRCVPVIVGDNVVAYGAAGDLHCVSLKDGSVRWSRPILAELQGDEGYFGAGSTPLVVNDLILVNVGGRNGAGLAAFALATGKTVWQSGDESASYSAPTLVMRGQRPIAVFVTRYNCVAVEPATGKTVFRFPFGKRGPTVNAATPLVFDGQLFLSASYGIGAVLKKWDGEAPADVWANDDTLSSQYSTAVSYQGHLYGSHGREDAGRAELRCVVAKTGKVAWAEPEFGVAHVIRADDKLLIVATDGRLTLAQATPASFRKLGQATVGKVTTRALPALSAGRLLLRTNERSGNGGELLCLDVASAP